MNEPLHPGIQRFARLSCLGMLTVAGCASPVPKDAQPAAPVEPAASAAGATNRNPGPLRFVVSFPATARSEPLTSRVLLFLSRSAVREPRFALDFFNLQPVFAIDVTNLAPGAPVVFSPAGFRAPDALAFPGPLERLEPGTWFAQALFDVDNTRRDFATGPGNLFSKPMKCDRAGARGGTMELSANQVVAEKPPKDTDWVKLVEVRSRLLSDFHRRDILLRAAVILPAGYAQKTNEHFPALYVVPGFGGRHTSAWSWIDSDRGQRWRKGEVPAPTLRVVLDPDVPLGHSVFANSANNGPVGDALVRELIPEIERRFRAIPQAYGRLVTGHSSGGWASLWLQVTYPDVFGGCWSTAPDPVDFRAFQTLNIYEDRNGHWTREGQPRPVGRNREKVMLTFERLNLWEHVTGHGGQLDSFDAVFGPRGADGRPRRLMHKLTGALDREVAGHWRRYDIRRVLEENWITLGPKLKGKLHVIAGGWDTFYLNPAVEYLREFLEQTEHGGYVKILPGDHGSVITATVREQMEREMGDQLIVARRTFAASQSPPAHP